MGNYFGLKKRPTVERIRKMKCFRCGAPSCYSTWEICSNVSRHVPICVRCDLALNRMVLKFMGVEKERIGRIMARYEKKVAASL